MKSFPRLNRQSTLTNYFAKGSAIAAIAFSTSALAHFQELIPDRDFADNDHRQPLNFEIQFTHPMAQGPLMNMVKPKQFRVKNNQGDKDLLPLLKEVTHSSDQAELSSWSVQYPLTTAGDHIFYIEPQPYWEADENKMIIHYTKVIVDAFGELQGWDNAIGLPVEIEPLTRPYSLWTGNAFQGIVKKQGKAVPFAEVEVEWRNDGSVKNIAENYTTQVIKADANGTFSYVMPRAGWWGFAALIDADYQLASPDNNQVDVELGGLIWVNAKDMPKEK